MHENHRERMRERFLKQGGEGFADHEILEMFLYATQPRCNTNPTAHELLDRFGSIKNFVNADYDDLLEVGGMGCAASFSVLINRELCRRYFEEYCTVGKQFLTMNDSVNFLYPKFIGCTNEVLYMLLFNNRMNLLDAIPLSQGGTSFAHVPVSRIVELAIKKKASAVMLAHNHPDGIAVPSSNALEVTDTVYRLLDLLNISLVEHILIAGDHVYPILKYRMGIYHPGPVRTQPGESFYNSFYDIDDKTYCIPITM